MYCGNAGPDLIGHRRGWGREIGAAALWRERPRSYDVREVWRIPAFANKRVCDRRLCLRILNDLCFDPFDRLSQFYLRETFCERHQVLGRLVLRC
jgi:hypothetical protein